jgi:erythromycin esterase-like protein
VPALPDSYESFLHVLGPERFWLPLKGQRDLAPPELLERAIGVLYLPHQERQSHYFAADLAHQFDALIHIDETTALAPLERGELWHPGAEVPGTYPFAADTGI